MNKDGSKIDFIQPLPATLKKVKALVKKNKKQLKNPSAAFNYHKELLYHLVDKITFEQDEFKAHMFFNEKLEIDQKHSFLSSIIELEKKVSNKSFERLKDYLNFKKSNIPKNHSDYFKWNKKSLKIERNTKRIKAYINKMGTFILATNQGELDKIDILNHYRQRDSVEKIFDIVKDNHRLRSHSSYNTDGRLFIKFIALIIHSKITKVMSEKKLFSQFSVRELLADLKKLKVTKIRNEAPIISELTKKHKNIIEAFGIPDDFLHSY